MSDMMANHVSAHVPGEPGAFLINAYGLMYEEITASSLVKVNLAGDILAKPDFGELDYGINRAGYVIHSCIHRARPDAHAIMHTHSRAGVAVSAMKCGLLPLSQHAMRVQQRVTYHGYEGIALELDEQERLVRDLGPQAPAMILRNHGLLAVGASTHEAFEVMYYLECACQIQVDAMAGGIDNVVAMPAAAADTADAQFHDATRTKGARAWTSLLRMLDRLGSDFRD
jgi:ribulose-5-phosphate 4-epimerase/fuculose-1-phosphate aldolase